MRTHAASRASSARAAARPAATNAPAALGALAAALAALELHKHLGGTPELVAAGREIRVDARHGRLLATHQLRDLHCRFDHEPPWRIAAAPGALTLRGALALAGALGDDASLEVAGAAFVGATSCGECERVQGVWRLARALSREPAVCTACGEVLALRGFDLRERIGPRDAPAAVLDQPLRALGLDDGDFFTVRGAPEGPLHFELGAGAQATGRVDTVLLIGAGNIGTHLAPLVARTPGVRRVRLVDPDRFEPHNLIGQALLAAELGRAKVHVVAERLRRIRADLAVETFEAALEELPLGLFRNAVVMAGLDSRAARQRLGERCWRAGSIWIDAGVDGATLQARITVFAPGPAAACFTCGWSDADYDALEQRVPCAGCAPEVAWTAP